MTTASLGRLENGISSVMHSSISIANEYVSEFAVGGTLVSSISSGAEYLATFPDDIVFEIELSLLSSPILAIPKSQICGSPLPLCSQLLFRRWVENEEFTSGEISTFLCAPSVGRLQENAIKNSHI
jgi:hypothetical protein